MRAYLIRSLSHLPLCSLAALTACTNQHAPTTAPQTNAPLPAIRYEAHLAAGGQLPPAGALHNPHAGDAAVAKTGATLFTAMNCDGCHGLGGTGWVGPSLADKRWRYGGSEGEIFASIYYGRPKGMPAFGGALGSEGIWALVTYLQSLPAPSDDPTEAWPD